MNANTDKDFPTLTLYDLSCSLCFYCSTSFIRIMKTINVKKQNKMNSLRGC